MPYLDHYSPNRKGGLTKGQDRQHMISAVMDSLRDWRLSEFEHEAETRYAVRNLFIDKGYGWTVCDHEAETILALAFARMGLKRPSWVEGQWQYTAARQNCVRCGGNIDDEDQGRGYRFCSTVCASAAKVSSDERLATQDAWVYHRAVRELKMRSAKARPCKVCAKIFRAYKKTTVICSPACHAKALTTRPDISCECCNKTFRQKAETQTCCSLKCAGAMKVVRLRARAPDQCCPQCSTVFRPTKIGQIFCSKPCARTPERRAAEYLKRKQKQAAQSNVVYLTAEIFDNWFSEAA